MQGSQVFKICNKCKPKIADYPFTTLFPNLGVIRYKNYKDIIIADIPGIIKNAYKGLGLGLKFLGHIEKCTKLLHFVDISKKDIIKHYKIIRNELTNMEKD